MTALRVSLRPLAPGDIPSVAAIHVASFRESGPDAMLRATLSLEEDLLRGWAHVWVACIGDDVVGAFVAWIVVDEVHLLDVATHPAHRRRGVGRALVDALLALARREHAVQIYLEARRSNVAATTLYRSVGFAAVGLRQKYYPDEEDAVEMALTLDRATGAVVPRTDLVSLVGE